METNKKSWLRRFIDSLISGNTASYHYTPPVKEDINRDALIDVLWNAESSRGTNVANKLPTRQTTPQAVNNNDKPQSFDYNNKYAVQFGLTPIAISELSKAEVNKNNPQGNLNGPTNFIRKTKEIQDALNNGTTTAGGIGADYFNMIGNKLKKDNPEKYNFNTAEGLANIYVDGYMRKTTGGKLNPNYNQDNYDRVKEYFQSKLPQ